MPFPDHDGGDQHGARVILSIVAAQAAAAVPASGPEVVIRARPRGEQPYRIRPIPGAERFERTRRDGLPPAAIAAFGGTLAAEAESAQLAGGQISKRAMIRFKKPF